ncbi:serum paraoxonase/lactonase 3-like [Glandiceps talaboti]
MLGRLVLLVIVAVIGTHIAKMIYSMGYHKTIYNHEPGPCRLVPGIDAGSEDITVTKNGIAFISSGLRIKIDVHLDPSRGIPNIRGRIFLFDFNHPEKNSVELPLNGDFDRDNFYPHGISVYENPKTGEVRLFAVNHHISNQERIEIFRFDEKTTSLNHLKTVTGEYISSVNDIVAIGPEAFYFTNDMYFTGKKGKTFEQLSAVEWGSLGVYDTTDRLVSSGYAIPNGINVSPDGRYVYVASSMKGQVLVFERTADNSLKRVQTINVGTGVDNIEVDLTTGDLWLGCHPVFHMLQSHTTNISKPAGSQVLRVRLNSKSAPYTDVDIKEVFMNDGSLLSGGSVARFYDNKLLIGTVWDKTAFCEILAF